MQPPPAWSASQNHALCGPGCVSRLRTHMTSPIAPAPTAGQRLERLRCVHEVLEVAAEHPGRLDEIEDPLGLGGRAAERLGAQHGLAGCGRRGDRFLVHVVGQADHDGVDVGMVDGFFDARRGVGDVPPLPERLASLDRPRVHDLDTVAAALAVQGHGVEVADQPGAEHGDAAALFH